MAKMAKDGAVGALIVPATEIFSETFITIFDTVNTAKSVIVHKENFRKHSYYLELIAFILKELSKMDVKHHENLKGAVEFLNEKITVAKRLALKCSNRNKIYLLLSCHRIVKDLEDSTKEIGRALTLIPISCFEGSQGINDELHDLCKDMSAAEYQAMRAEEEILEKIELVIGEGTNVEPSYANGLLNSIAEVVGISTAPSELRRELEGFKSEMQNVELREDITEALRMEQIIALLGQADLTATPHEREEKYFTKLNSLGRKLLEPLQSFYCPITGDIMADPVETPSGQSFERSAIEKWLADGNNLCPLTKTPLNKLLLRSNRNLIKLIEEWKDRNTMITIASMKQKILSEEEQEVLHCLGQLQDLCLERELHQEWVIMEDYLPILIGLLSDKNREVRKHALMILCILAKDHDGHKEKVVQVDNAIEFIVRALARKVDESKLALQLLLELSRNDAVRSSIGNVQGCILLLVTMSSCDDTQAVKDAEELLGNVSFIDQNVIEMAKANYFGPLLHLLSSGSESVRLKMAKTLSELELTDHKKLSLYKEGAHRPLLELLREDDIEIKKVAIKALQNLSSIPQNGLQIIREGLAGPLFELLYCSKFSSPSFRKEVATVVLHLAISATSPEAEQMQVSILESEDDIFKLFSLVSLTGPDVQQSILLSFYALSQPPSGLWIRTILRQISATKVLVQLCEDNNYNIRSSAVNLFYCLTKDGENTTFLEHVNQRCIGTLLRIIRTSNDLEEITSALGIVSNLPRDIQLTQLMLDAGALQDLFTHLASGDSHALHKRDVIENATGALCRFTVSTNQEWQKKVAEAGYIPILVSLLISGSSLIKQNVAISLKQLSESSANLSRSAKKQTSFGCCFTSPETGCSIHSGICTVDSSFCLVEANAIGPLVAVLGEQEAGAGEASLDALMTLIEGELLQRGSKVLAGANAIAPMIKLLSSPSLGLQEKALNAVERIFRLVEFKERYGASAQLPLVDITQRGSTSMKSLAAKTLAHLNVLHHQSSYF